MPNGTIIGVDSTGVLYYYAKNLTNVDAWKLAPSAITVGRVRSLMNGSIIGIQRSDGSLVHK